MRPDTQDLITANLDKTDAEIVAFVTALPPTAKPSDVATTYATYVSIGKLFDTNTAGTIANKLEAWFGAADLSQINPALPNPSALRRLHNRLDTYPGLDFSDAQVPGLLTLFTSGVDATHPPILTVEQSAALLSIGYTLAESVTEADVAAVRSQRTRSTNANALLVKLATYTSYVGSQINGYVAGATNELPTVPEVPQA